MIIFNPIFIFISVWIFQACGYLIFRDTFGPYSNTTWIVVFGSVLLFSLGGILSLKTKNIFPVDFKSNWLDSKRIIFFANWFLRIYPAIFIFALILIAYFLKVHPEPVKSLTDIRTIFNLDIRDSRKIYNTVRIFHLGLAASIFLLAMGSSLSTKLRILIFSLGFLSAVATTGRLFVLLFFIAASAIFFHQGIIKLKGIIIISFVFLAQFFIWALLLNKISIGYGGVVEKLTWHLKVYFFSALSAFNNFVVKDYPRFSGVLIIPNAVKTVFNVFGAGLSPRPIVAPFVYVPLETNVYTVFYPFYHDGGLGFVASIMLLLGYVHQQIYSWLRKYQSGLSLYVFSLSLYPLVMTCFDEAYFSSPGVWFVFVLPIAAFIILNLILDRNKEPVKEGSI